MIADYLAPYAHVIDCLILKHYSNKLQIILYTFVMFIETISAWEYYTEFIRFFMIGIIFVTASMFA